jgi:hypothetical protein
MNTFIKIIVAAILVESVLETIMLVVDAAGISKKEFIGKVGSLIIGLTIAFSYSLDLPSIIGLTDGYKLFGVILTGILISRGSNFIHDLIKIIQNSGLAVDEKEK